MSSAKLRKKKIIAFLGSPRLALVLFWLVIAVSFIGALVREDLRGLVFGSLWFIGLLAVLGLNICVCTLSRISFSAKKTGSTLVHLAVLLILAGALISWLFGIRGTMEIEKGQCQDRINLGCSLYKLDFKICLREFAIDYYQPAPQFYPIKVFVEDSRFKAEYKLEKGSGQILGDTGYSLELKDYLGDLRLDENMKAKNLSEQPNNPAVLLKINSPKGIEERWVFANHPDMGMIRDKNIRLRFSWAPMVKEYRSMVKVADEKRKIEFERAIKVNQPLSYRGFVFYQMDYDHEKLQYTVLEAVRDPGTGFVFAGFLMLNIGLIMIFYPKLRGPAKNL